MDNNNYIKDIYQLQYIYNNNLYKDKQYILYGDICFNIPYIYEHYKNFPINIIPNECNGYIDSFFIRPEDIYLYKPYVNKYIYKPMDNKIIQNIYNNQKWFGNLQQIIIGLKEQIDNRRIIPIFGQIRLNKNNINIDIIKNICKQIKNTQSILKEYGSVIGFDRNKRIK